MEFVNFFSMFVFKVIIVNKLRHGITTLSDHFIRFFKFFLSRTNLYDTKIPTKRIVKLLLIFVWKSAEQNCTFYGPHNI
jgi:hypothetical protein